MIIKKLNRDTASYGYYYLKPYLLMLACFIIFGSMISAIGYFLKHNLLFYFGLGIICYGILTTIGWLLSRYVIPGNRIDVARRSIAELNLTGDEKILDVGSGRGLYAIEAAKVLKTGRVYAIDIWDDEKIDVLIYHQKFSRPSGNTLKNAIKNTEIEGVRKKIEFINMDINHLNFKDIKVDIVICAFIISHLWKFRNGIMKNIKEVLKSRGKIIIIDNYICLTYFLLSTPHLFLYSYLKKTKARYLKKENWIGLLRNNGFTFQNTVAQKGIIRLIGINSKV